MTPKRRARVKPKTRAVDRWSKFVLKTELKDAKQSYKQSLENLRKKSRLYRRVRKMAFPCSVQVQVENTSVTFSPPKGGWKDTKEFHRTLARILTQFGIRMEREFESWNGSYVWTGTTKDKITVTLDGAVKPDNCEIVPYIDTVTRYKSICGKEDNKTAA